MGKFSNLLGNGTGRSFGLPDHHHHAVRIYVLYLGNAPYPCVLYHS